MQTTIEIHVTAIRNGGVYGHETTHCDDSGCAGNEMFWREIDPDAVTTGDVLEIAETKTGWKQTEISEIEPKTDQFTPKLFRSAGHRAVLAASAESAAHVFATREARQRYGRNGYCRTIRLNTTCGNSAHYQTFIGRDAIGGGTSGHNVWITVKW